MPHQKARKDLNHTAFTVSCHSRTMKTCQRAPFLVLWLITVFVLLSFLLLPRHSGDEDGASLSGLRIVPRRILGSAKTTYAAGHKHKEIVKGAWKTLKTSLRRAPRSGSNPTQNKHPLHS